MLLLSFYWKRQFYSTLDYSLAIAIWFGCIIAEYSQWQIYRLHFICCQWHRINILAQKRESLLTQKTFWPKNGFPHWIVFLKKLRNGNQNINHLKYVKHTFQHVFVNQA